jgi:hypothetical protein
LRAARHQPARNGTTPAQDLDLPCAHHALPCAAW